MRNVIPVEEVVLQGMKFIFQNLLILFENID